MKCMLRILIYPIGREWFSASLWQPSLCALNTHRIYIRHDTDPRSPERQTKSLLVNRVPISVSMFLSLGSCMLKYILVWAAACHFSFAMETCSCYDYYYYYYYHFYYYNTYMEENLRCASIHWIVSIGPMGQLLHSISHRSRAHFANRIGSDMPSKKFSLPKYVWILLFVFYIYMEVLCCCLPIACWCSMSIFFSFSCHIWLDKHYQTMEAKIRKQWTEYKNFFFLDKEERERGKASVRKQFQVLFVCFSKPQSWSACVCT